MAALAKKIETERWEQSAALVRAVHGEQAQVALPSGALFMAQRATSCLVAPEDGDRVLVAWSGDEAYVTAVLERTEGATLKLVMRANTDLVVNGALSIASRAFSLSSSRALFDVEHVDAVFGKVEAVIERVFQRVKRSYRFVEETDHVRAGCIDVAAENTMSLHAENTMVTADGLVKVDAEQIQLG